MARNNWSWEETLMAFALYLILPPREIDDTGIDVINLAQAIGRTPSAVAYKIWNIAAHDECRTSIGRVGFRHGSKLDKMVWEQFVEQGDILLDEAVKLLDASIERSGKPSSTLSYAMVDLPEGKERETLVSQRVNQQYFRNTLLENYRSACCITGIKIVPLLVASHIKPWSQSNPRTERLAPSNGLLLNALHDKAFDTGIITIDTDYRIIVSHRAKRDNTSLEWLYRYEGNIITLPKCNLPSKELIEYHNDMIFQR